MKDDSKLSSRNICVDGLRKSTFNIEKKSKQFPRVLMNPVLRAACRDSDLCNKKDKCSIKLVSTEMLDFVAFNQWRLPQNQTWTFLFVRSLIADSSHNKISAFIEQIAR